MDFIQPHQLEDHLVINWLSEIIIRFMENNPTSPAISDWTSHCKNIKVNKLLFGGLQMSLSGTVIWGEGVGEERQQHWEDLGIKILPTMFCTAVLG